MSTNLAVIFTAMQFAAVKHRHQRRKGGKDVPYINHPIDVATLLATVGGITDPEILAAALLHDTVEDTDTNPGELEAVFGPVIAALVEEVTDDPSLTSAEQKARQEAEVSFKSPRAKLIRLADKTCNVRDVSIHPPPTWSLARQAWYFDWAERVIRGLRGVHPRLEEEFDLVLSRAREAVPRPTEQRKTMGD